MSRNLFAKAYFFGYYYFFRKSNSDLCCSKFRPTTEIHRIPAPHGSPCGAFLFTKTLKEMLL